MQVEIWSDVVCPWCYIGKRRFETALQRVADHRDVSSIDVVYRPYQLDPTARPGMSEPVVDTYARKFGGPERAAEIFSRVTSVGAADGIDFEMQIAIRANTLLAHRLLWFAEQRDDAESADGTSAHTGRQIALEERLLRAYFTEGLDIGDPEVLTECATQVGLERADVSSFLAGDGGHGEVMQDLATAAANGITAVPTFVFNGQFAVPGAQDAAFFERVLEKLLDDELEEVGNV